MKKSATLLVVLAFISIHSFSQKMTLCEAFGQLVQLSDSGFVPINGDKKPQGSLVIINNSKIEISEAVETEIQVLTFNTEFVANYGNFKTEQEALAKVEILKKNFTACFPMIRFSDYSVDILKSLHTNIIEQADKGFRYYKANFKIDKWNDTYTVKFIYPSPTKVHFFGDKEPTFIDYYTVPTQLDNQQYAQDIRKIIAEGKTGFDAIKGEKLASTINGFECYESSLKVDGVSNCYIEDRTMGIYNYVIPIAKNVEMATIQKTAEEYLAKFMSALGPDYAFKMSKDQMIFDFVHKNQPKNKIATFLIQMNDTKFDLSIFISAKIPN
jgi:hypothetical protein